MENKPITPERGSRFWFHGLSTLAALLIAASCPTHKRAVVTPTPSPHRTVLSWHKSTSWKVNHYYVYRNINGDGWTLIAKLGDVDTYKDDGIPCGVEIQYRVTSVEEAPAHRAESDPTPPIIVRAPCKTD